MENKCETARDAIHPKQYSQVGADAKEGSAFAFKVPRSV
jgi:hypothetical protein